MKVKTIKPLCQFKNVVECYRILLIGHYGEKSYLFLMKTLQVLYEKNTFLINPVSGKLVGQSLKDCLVSELNGVLEHESFDIEYSEIDIEGQCNNLLSSYEIVVAAGGDSLFREKA